MSAPSHYFRASADGLFVPKKKLKKKKTQHHDHSSSTKQDLSDKAARQTAAAGLRGQFQALAQPSASPETGNLDASLSQVKAAEDEEGKGQPYGLAHKHCHVRCLWQSRPRRDGCLKQPERLAGLEAKATVVRLNVCIASAVA